MDAITASVKKFAREIAGVSDSTAWAMIARGEVETISIGKRRLVVVESYRRRVEKLKAQPPQDARRNRTVPAFGSGRSRARFGDNETAPATASSGESGLMQRTSGPAGTREAAATGAKLRTRSKS
jgi:hypothetical protein